MLTMYGISTTADVIYLPVLSIL